jgi:transposase
VEWGLAHRQLAGVESLGIDEIHWGQGKRADPFLTVIYQIDQGCRRLLWVGRRRTQATLRRGLDALGPQVLSGLRFVWKVARMLRKQEPLLLNWFKARGEVSSGAVEGLNNKIRVVTRRSYGFRTIVWCRSLHIGLLSRHPQDGPGFSFGKTWICTLELHFRVTGATRKCTELAEGALGVGEGAEVV